MLYAHESSGPKGTKEIPAHPFPRTFTKWKGGNVVDYAVLVWAEGGYFRLTEKLQKIV